MIMKGKMKFCILVVFVLTVAAMWFGTKEVGCVYDCGGWKVCIGIESKGFR